MGHFELTYSLCAQVISNEDARIFTENLGFSTL